jgi:hypothetical protein
MPGLIRRQSLLTIVALCLFLLCAWRYYRKTIYLQLPGLIDTPSDFKPYYEAARNILHGNSPFLAEGYIYPPLLAFLVTPLAELDYVTARRTWFLLSQLFLIASAFLLWRSFGRDWTAACWIAFVWAMGGSAAEALGLGQVGPLLTLFVALAFTSRRWRPAAVSLGFAIKLFPGILGVAVLLRGDRRAVRWLFLGALIVMLLPWAAVASFLQGPVGLSTGGAWTGTPATLSWSLPSVVLRILDPPRQVYPLPLDWVAGTDLQHFRLPLASSVAALATALLTLCAGLFALTRSVRNRLTEDQVPWAMAALISLALAASPVGWTHYQVLQYPGVALLLTYSWRRRQWMRLIVALALAGLLYPIPVSILGDYYLRYHAWTANSLSTLYVWTSVTPFASLGLFALFLRQARGLPGIPAEPTSVQSLSRPGE